VNQGGYWYAGTACPECNAGRLAFAVRRDGRTCFLLCRECGANYLEPSPPSDHNPALDTPADELEYVPGWATREEIEARGWGAAVAGYSAGGG
jgi:hypothetical protein